MTLQISPKNRDTLELAEAQRFVNRSSQDLQEISRIVSYLSAISLNLPTGTPNLQLQNALTLQKAKELEYITSVAMYSGIVKRQCEDNNLSIPEDVTEYLANCATIGIVIP